jgi:hypothetical protein
MMNPIIEFKSAKTRLAPLNNFFYNIDPVLELNATGRYSIFKKAKESSDLSWENT